MTENRKEYLKNYKKERQVQCYPPLADLRFIRSLQSEKGMSESEAVCHLIRVAKATIIKTVSKNSY